ncbi:hypothetical protein ABCS64_01950 [Rhodocyclaceae bacterium Wk13]|uniref:Uncharacterized protein n=1 Tax=Dentiradicibacter hellwigii TaxID=3149053 RepID=A0ABV4UBS1_9RHOO
MKFNDGLQYCQYCNGRPEKPAYRRNLHVMALCARTFERITIAIIYRGIAPQIKTWVMMSKKI